MIIGIDIDNTITHTTEMIMHYAGIFGRERGLNTVPNMNYYYLEEALGWPKETADEFFDIYLERIYTEIRPKDQAIETIRHLKNDHEIILITSRNKQFPKVEEVTVSWLNRNQVPYDQLILNKTEDMHFFSKLAVCLEQQVDFMIEDHYQLAQEISQVIPVVLFDYPYNRHVVSDNIFRVKNWNEVKQWIEGFRPRQISDVV